VSMRVTVACTCASTLLSFLRSCLLGYDAIHGLKLPLRSVNVESTSVQRVSYAGINIFHDIHMLVKYTF
jgi:hypothetical protein